MVNPMTKEIPRPIAPPIKMPITQEAALMFINNSIVLAFQGYQFIFYFGALSKRHLEKGELQKVQNRKAVDIKQPKSSLDNPSFSA
jgi:hypothetical protein